MDIFIEMAIALPLLLLWLVVVSVIVRPFGVQMPLRPFSFRQRKSVFQSLTFSQYVGIVGVLYFGCGMFIATTVSRYIEWKYFHGSSNSLSQSELLRNAFTWPLLAGFMFGVLSFLSR